MFTATQLRLLFYFLLKPDMINAGYREIAKIAGVSLDIVSKTIRGLKGRGWVIQVDKKRQKLNRTKELFDKWLVGFEVTLRNKIKMGCYRFPGTDILINWKKIPLEKKSILWGAEPAAAILTDYLHPEQFILYSSLSNMELMKNYKFIPDESGNIEIRDLFFDPAFFDCADTVPPLLVYADLMISADSRNIETAKQIYDQFLTHLFV